MRDGPGFRGASRTNSAPVGAGNDQWIAVRIGKARNRERVISALFLAGSTGVQEDGQDIVTHFPSGSFTQKLRDSIAVADPGATVVTANAAAIDYSEWRAAVVSHRIGGLTVAPPWLASDGEEGRTIVIDPAMAFGTGEHATTRGVIRLMQQIPEISGLVADLGSGSAILAIAAAKLGAARVAAIEMDADAIGNAQDNVAANGVADRVHVIEGDAGLLLPLVAPVDVVLANIVSSVLLGMLPVIAEAVRLDGHAILSGILVEERTIMLAAIGEVDWRIAGEDTEAGWWSVMLERR